MMPICKNCQQTFSIYPEDREFYQRIEVPEPTLCPDCRQQRKLAYKNDKTLYNDQCQLCGKEIISMYDPKRKYVIYCQDCWWSDNWDSLKYGQDFDFSRPFFEQFKELQIKVPRVALVNNKAEDSLYCNFADRNKSCYLITTANDNENCCYGFWMLDNKDCFDLLYCRGCQYSYELIDCNNCYQTSFNQLCSDCSFSQFLYDCRNCHNCLGCVGLRYAEYHIFNKPYSEEEYEKKVKKLEPREIRDEFEKLKLKYIRKESNNHKAENCLGDYLSNCRNIRFSFDVHDSQSGAYLVDGLRAKDSYDTISFDGIELCYETMSAIGYHYLFSYYCRDSRNLNYCDSCYSSADLFGCIGLRHQEFCIFNKKYSEKDYEESKKKIIEHMQKTGEYGETFPARNSLFGYNETLAQTYFPLTKEKALKRGYSWKDPEPQHIPQPLPPNIKQCSSCQRYFNLIPQELRFYQEQHLPLPQNCPNCRHKARLALRNPRKLWLRTCAKCKREIQTTYSPDRPEIIYCEKCYLKEVY